MCVSENSNLVHIETSLEAPNGGKQIATTNSGKKDERIANAAFIVRACNSHYELLAELKKAVEYLPDCDAALAVIAKAESAE